MAMASGVFGVTLRNVLNSTQLAVNTGSDTFKMALVSDTYTPDFNAHDFFNDVTGEITGTGYTAGGNALTTVTLTAASGFLVFDADDTSWTGATFSGVRGRVIFDNTLTSDPLLVATTFGSDFSVTSGTFTVQESANGIWRIDYIP